MWRPWRRRRAEIVVQDKLPETLEELEALFFGARREGDIRIVWLRPHTDEEQDGDQRRADRPDIGGPEDPG